MSPRDTISRITDRILEEMTDWTNRPLDLCIVICDGLKGLPEAISETRPLAVIQTCVLHLDVGGPILQIPATGGRVAAQLPADRRRGTLELRQDQAKKEVNQLPAAG